MRYWKRLAAVVALAMLPGLQAQAAIFQTTDGLAGQDVQVRTYAFNIAAPADYFATLFDLEYPAAFKSLTLAVAKTGGGVILGSTPGPGTFSFTADTAGSYSLLLVGEPSSSAKAGFYSIDVTQVPEPAVWLMIGAGALMMGVLRLRARERFG